MVVEIEAFDPYIGPRPFERGELDGFYGRDQEVSDLLSYITANRVVVLYAASGAGKTSLLNAGLIPELEEEGFQVYRVTRVGGAVPEGVDINVIDNVYVYNALIYWSDEDDDPTQYYNTTLEDYIQTTSPDPQDYDDDGLEDPRVIIFDQFEEIFNFYPERWQDRERFFEQLAAALEADPLLRVILSLREDYIAPLDPYARILPGRMQARFRLERLKEAEALGAIREPLKGTPYGYAEGVAEQLVVELRKQRIETANGETMLVEGEYIEPVQLQVVCQSLWRSLPDDTEVINEEHLRALGGVTQALSDFYQRNLRATLEQVPSIRESQLRDWFEHKLITPAGTRATVYRGRSDTEGIPNRAVDMLENLYLIRGQFRAGARWYELTHDQFVDPVLESNRRFNLERDRMATQRLRRLALIVGGMALLFFVLFGGSVFQIFQTSEELRDTREMEEQLRGQTREAQIQAGELLLQQGEYQEALTSFENALESEASDDAMPEDELAIQGMILVGIGLAQVGLENYDAAETAANEASTIYVELGNQTGEAQALAVLGLVDAGRAQYTTALVKLEDALSKLEETNDRAALAQTQLALASVLNELNRPAEALATLEMAQQNALNAQPSSDAATLLLVVADAYALIEQRDLQRAALIDAGRVYIEAEQYQNAITTLNRALEIALDENDLNDETEISQLLGVANFNLTNYNESLQLLRRARNLQSFSENYVDAAAINIIVSDVYTAREDTTLALDALDRAQMNIQTAIDGGFSTEGAVRVINDALARYQQIGNQSGEAKALALLGELQRLDGDFETSLETYQASLDLYQNVGEQSGMMAAHYGRGLTYAEMGQNANAIEEVRAALTIAEALGEINQQIVYLMKIVELEGEQANQMAAASATFSLATIYEQNGDSARAIEVYNQAATLQRDAGDQEGLLQTLVALSALQVETGEVEAALQTLESGVDLALELEDTGAAFNLADEAVKLTAELEEAAPRASALVLRSRVYNANGDYVAGLDDASQALSLNAEDADAYAAAGAALAGQQEYTEAAANYQQALGRAPERAMLYCEGSLEPRLELQTNGTVITQGNLRMRGLPSTDGGVVTTLVNGDVFEVVNGPVCVDGAWWWILSVDEGDGWVNEGIASDGYFLSPIIDEDAPINTP